MSIALVLVVLSALGGLESARILVAVPFPSISHQTPFRPIATELAKKGHHVTVITTDPMRKNITNYKEIDISPAYRYLRKSFDWIEFARKPWNPVDMLYAMEDMAAPICEDGLNSPELKAFLKSPPKFDLYILERALTPCFYGVQHAVGSPPIVGFVSLGAYHGTHYAHKNPSNPAYIPQWVLPYSDHMSFWQRLHSTYIWLYDHFMWVNVVLPRHDEIQRKYFGPDVPSVFEVERNFSLMLLSNHFSVSYPRPNLPNFIELTGLNVARNTTPLPKDIQEWLDGADEGVIYFSLGTNVRGSSMSEEMRRAFLDVFAERPQRVLWKWETETTDVPSNVKVSKWLPQQSILAHPNVRAFITQGGLQSFNEAVYYGVPLVGIPFMGDQHYNVAKMVAAGIGYELQFRYIAKATVSNALKAVIDDQRYRENVKRLSLVYREHQAESVQRAVWWIEYVLRHNGAPHLRSAALDLSWYQLLLLDVVAFVLAVAVASGVALYALARFLISTMCKPRKLKGQ